MLTGMLKMIMLIGIACKVCRGGAAFWAAPGCGDKHYSRPRCADGMARMGIRCCASNLTAQPPCISSCYDIRNSLCEFALPLGAGTFATHAEAEAECRARSGRLCTRRELFSGVCCRTGCRLDDESVWTAESCSESEPVSSSGIHRQHNAMKIKKGLLCKDGMLIEQTPKPITSLTFPSMRTALTRVTGGRGVVVDVGANGGTEIKQALALGHRVIAIECLPSAFSNLRKAFEMIPSRVRLHFGCAAAEPGELVLHVDPTRNGDSSSLFPDSELKGLLSKDGILRKLLPTKAKDATIETTRVPALVLDTLLRNTTGIRLIKIDTQGAEEAVLLGLNETLQREQPVLLYESYVLASPAGLRVRARLSDMGYLCSPAGAPSAVGTDTLCVSGRIPHPSPALDNLDLPRKL